MSTRSTQTLTIHPVAPFDFRWTLENQAYYRRGEDAAPDVYQRLLDLGGKLALATISSGGGSDRPELAVGFQGEELTDPEIQLAQTQLERLLGSAEEVEPFYRFVEDDPVMSNLTRGFYGMHQTLALSVFETIAQAILGQQLSASVARVIRALLVETYGPRLQVNGEVHYAFPRPEAIAAASVEDLRQLKLSQRKAEYLHGLAVAELETPGGLGQVQGLPDNEVIQEITSLRGVGMWSAQWVLSRALGRPDAFPVGDLALKRIVSQLYFGGEALTDAELGEYSVRWSPYRSLATSYLFAALRTGRRREFVPGG